MTNEESKYKPFMLCASLCTRNICVDLDMCFRPFFRGQVSHVQSCVLAAAARGFESDLQPFTACHRPSLLQCLVISVLSYQKSHGKVKRILFKN